MKRFILIITLTALIANQVSAASLVQTDKDEVLDYGTNSSQGQVKIEMSPGLYALNEIDTNWSTKYYLLMDNFVNDPEKFIAILFKEDAFDSSRRTIARMYQGRPVKGSSMLMLSPLIVDNSGNVRVQSEIQTDAPVIEVIARAGGDYRYPYVLRGRNGALDGRLYGMRGSSNKRPTLKPWPSSGVFASTNGTEADLMVSGTEVSLYNGSMVDQTYNLIALNGEQGKFAALTKSTFDTMGEVELANEQIRKLATFVTGCFDREVLMILTPTTQWGAYTLDLFRMAEPGLLESIFSGRKKPKY